MLSRVATAEAVEESLTKVALGVLNASFVGLRRAQGTDPGAKLQLAALAFNRHAAVGRLGRS